MHATGYRENEAAEDELFASDKHFEVPMSGSQMLMNLSLCSACGAWVGDTATHARWHKEIESRK